MLSILSKCANLDKFFYNSHVFILQEVPELLPLISEEAREIVFKDMLQDVNAWRKSMIHYIKEENPEVNAAIIEAANNTSLDPKAVALGAYMVYSMLEMAKKEENQSIEDFLE